MTETTTEFCVNCGSGVKGPCMNCSHDGSPDCDCIYCKSGGADRAANYEQPFYDLADNCLVVRRMLDGDVYLEADSLLRFTSKTWAEIMEFSTMPMPAIKDPCPAFVLPGDADAYTTPNSVAVVTTPIEFIRAGEKLMQEKKSAAYAEKHAGT